jgi:hypothetical protein
VYHLSQDQIEALRAPHDSTINPENFPWRWSSGVFERLEAGKRAVPRGTVKVTIEMPESYSGIEMPRDLLVRDEAELARVALEEENDDESSGLSDLDDADSDSELSELDDEMFEAPGMEFLHTQRPAREEEMNDKDDENDSNSELSDLDEEMFESCITRAEKEAKKEKAQEAEQEDNDESDLDEEE